MAALTGLRKAFLIGQLDDIATFLAETDPSTVYDPEAPTPAEIENVSHMLDEANGKLEIIRATATDPTTTDQAKLQSILETLGAP